VGVQRRSQLATLARFPSNWDVAENVGSVWPDTVEILVLEILVLEVHLLMVMLCRLVVNIFKLVQMFEYQATTKIIFDVACHSNV
jgi:hypothetical protein